MQTQLISDREFPHNHFNRRLNLRCDFPNAIKSRKENKIMIIKSFSVDHNQSLCVKSLLRKESQVLGATIGRNKLFKEQRVKEEVAKEKKQGKVGKDFNDCAEQLKHFRHLQKSDIFFKINEMERKISRQIRNAKQRENRRYMTESKTNKMKCKNNSINLTQISAAIKVKHMQNKPIQTPEKMGKHKTCTSFHQTRLIRIINKRFLRDLDAKSISISHLIKVKKANEYQKNLDEEFSGWKTQYDDF